MLNFDFLEKDLGKVSPTHFAYDFSRKMFLRLFLLTKQMSLPDWFCFLEYCVICVLRLFVNQVVAA